MVGNRSFILIVLIGLSISNNGKCLNDKPTTTANQFLISKWKMYYKACDVNHDGKVNQEDVKKSGNSFSDLEHLDVEKGNILTAVFTQYWDECIFDGRKGELLEQELVDSFKTKFNTNAEEFVKERHTCFERIFSAIDINKDKSISEEEFLVTYAAFGNQQLAKDNANFLAYKPNNGLVPLRMIVDSWVEFLTSTDESQSNVIKRGFEFDGFE